MISHRIIRLERKRWKEVKKISAKNFKSHNRISIKFKFKILIQKKKKKEISLG